jgi:hydrogenase/urease accessory protein HupE
MTFFSRVADAASWHDERHGPLPLLLFVLTMVTGLVDSVSYLKLGHVFVANMTGNVVFLGFAVADAEDFSIPASLVAIVAFLAGALAGVDSAPAWDSIAVDSWRWPVTSRSGWWVRRLRYR